MYFHAELGLNLSLEVSVCPRVCGAHGLPWTGRLTSKGGGSHSFALFVYDDTCEYAEEASDVPPRELCSIALAQGCSKVGSSG